MPLSIAATGAAGFLGGHLVRLLAERGDDVRAVYATPSG
jgi:nucleoside-diphosphate-sugar epimerase